MTQTVPPKICLEKHGKFVLLYDPPRKKKHLENHANMILYDLLCTTSLQQQISSSFLDFHAFISSKNMPTFQCYRLYGFVQYNLPHNNKFHLSQKKVFPWEICPASCSFLSSSKLCWKSTNLFFSLLSCTLPNAFCYNS
jgi:hypothetical protein